MHAVGLEAQEFARHRGDMRADHGRQRREARDELAVAVERAHDGGVGRAAGDLDRDARCTHGRGVMSGRAFGLEREQDDGLDEVAYALRGREGGELPLGATGGKRADREDDARLPASRHAHRLHAQELGKLVGMQPLARRRGVVW